MMPKPYLLHPRGLGYLGLGQTEEGMESSRVGRGGWEGDRMGEMNE